jgi:SAM-dependent methyltransferase
MRCNVCHAEMGPPIFDADSDRALTSLCELRETRTRVWACAACGHLRGEALPDTKEYYESQYRILLDQDEEDQIYTVQGDEIVYRTEHQVRTLLGKLQLKESALFLDYGCAKASTPMRLLRWRSDLQVHLFDVSDMYRNYWRHVTPEERCAVHRTPAHWNGRFDLVTSFFALEHIPDPTATVAHVASLLNNDGVFYGIVPDAFGNVADFVVVDHVSHFTAPSLHRLLRQAGFSDIRIDAHAHRGTLVFVAGKADSPTPEPNVPAALADARALAQYWDGLNENIRAAEALAGDEPAAIYGSGFYGAYIASTLGDPARVRCFLDRSPFQQGKTLFGKPVLPPEALPADIRTLYVGLNPSIARAAMASTNWPQASRMRFVYLEAVRGA